MSLYSHNRILLIIRLVFIFILSSALPALGQAEEVGAKSDAPLALQATTAIAIDADTGKIFFEKNSKTPVPIASMTKVITAYLVLEAEASGEISWDDTITIDDRLYRLSHNLELSNVPFAKDGTYTVKDLFNASMVLSANAAVTALAEHIAGSEKEFVDLMRKKVTMWGLNDVYLISPSGLNNEDVPEQMYPGSKDDEENLMSARDIAFVAQKLIQDFPEVLEITSQSSVLFPLTPDEDVEMISTNGMLPGFPEFKEGVDGFKTGTTDLAGRSFIGTIKKNDFRLITVVTGLPLDGQDFRFAETAAIMDYVYDNWAMTTLLKKGEAFPNYAKFPVLKGKEMDASVSLADDVAFWVESSMDTQHLTGSLIQSNLTDKNELIAPTKKGTEIASVEIVFSEDQLGYLTKPQQVATVPLVTTAEVEKANLFVLTGRSIKSFFQRLLG